MPISEPLGGSLMAAVKVASSPAFFFFAGESISSTSYTWTNSLDFYFLIFLLNGILIFLVLEYFEGGLVSLDFELFITEDF